MVYKMDERKLIEDVAADLAEAAKRIGVMGSGVAWEVLAQAAIQSVRNHSEET